MSDADAHRREVTSLSGRLVYYLTPYDGRFEDLTRGNLAANIFRDAAAGLIVAMVAIPLAMGFAMASGLPPEMGIVGGAVAGLVGALFGGSKFQVYGPTAAFIPIILGMTTAYEGRAFMIWCSILAGIVLMGMGLARLGQLIARVPNSIVIGFTLGIAVVIAMSQIGGVLGVKADLGHTFFEKVVGIVTHLGQVNPYAVIIAFVTFGMTWGLLRISKYIPAPLLALGASTILAATVWADVGLVLVRDKYGAIPTNLLNFTPPGALEITPGLLANMAYYVAAIVFVSGIESLLCSRMADRLADNRGIPYDPDKELWGQGWVQVIVVFLNGFPHTGALARTATNIKVGAMSPLAGVFKFAFKLALAAYLASWLEMVPIACVGGILLFVAFNMVKPAEVAAVWRIGWVHAAFMVYTAVMVAVTDFLVGVLTAMVLHAVISRLAPSWTKQPGMQLEHG